MLANCYSISESESNGDLITINIERFAATMSEKICPIVKLVGSDDYDAWSYEMQAYLEKEGLWEYAITDKKDIKDWSPTKSAKAKASIILCLSRACFVNTRGHDDPKAVWDALKTAYWDSGLLQKVQLLKEFVNLKVENVSSMEDYVNRMSEIVIKLREKGFDIGDEWVAHFILAGLPEEFKPMIMALQNSGTTLNLTAIKLQLIQEEQTRKKTETNTALVANQSWRKRESKCGKGKGQSNYQHNSQPNDRSGRKEVKCFKCEGFGHFADKCPSRERSNQATSAKPNIKGKPRALVAVASASDVVRNRVWVIDSGATSHMTNTYQDGIILKKCPAIYTADAREIAVTGHGNISITLVVNGERVKGRLNNVLYIPGLENNLLSVRAMTAIGKNVKFSGNKCFITEGKELIATGTLRDGLFLLDCEVDRAAVMVSQSPMLWHRRLGHLNANYISRLCDKIGAVKDHGNCLTCAKGKMVKKPFPSSSSISKECLELVHSDVAGWMDTESLGGKKYFITFIDDYSRRVCVYMMRCKSEAFEKFKLFKSYAERATGKQIKVLRTDNGGEYCSDKFESFLSEHGIVHQTTVAYNSQQNGVSERMNRTIMEKVRCMLSESGLPKSLWAEAVNTSVYLINRSPSSAIDYELPEERWGQKKVSVDHLRVFGSRCVVLVPKHKRRKLDQAGEEGVLVGYSQTKKAYRILMKDNTVKEDRDVKVFEDDSVNSQIKSDQSILVLDNDDNSGDDDSHSESDDEASENNFSTADESESFIEEDNINGDGDEKLPFALLQGNYNRTIRAPGLGEGPRRSPRTPKPLMKPDYVYLSYDRPIPGSFAEATMSIDAAKWKEAMDDEMNSLMEHRTWELVERPVKGKVIKSRWVFKVKETDDLPLFKARLVGKGFMQNPEGVETFSPVVRYETIRSVLAVAAAGNMTMRKFDVKTAFLNGKLNETVYMEQPEGYCDGSNRVCILHKSLYGLIQAPRCWGTRIVEVLEKFGMISCESDPCLFIKKINNHILILLLYVDDGLVVTSDVKMADELIAMLETEFSITKTNNVTSFLGMEIKQMNNCIGIGQKKYIERIVDQFRLNSASALKVPIRPGWDNVDSRAFTNITLYRELVGSLVYLTGVSRPDVAYAVNILSRALCKPTVAHFKLGKDIIRYLKGTKDKMIVYKGEVTNVNIFTDADYGGDWESRRSTSGLIGFIGEGPIIWRSRLQRIVTLSTTEAELIAGCEGTMDARWLLKLFKELGIAKIKPTVYIDNQSTLAVIKNPTFHSRTKHIDIKLKSMRELNNKGIMEFDYVKSESQLADGFTKALTGAKFDMFVNSSLGNI